MRDLGIFRNRLLAAMGFAAAVESGCAMDVPVSVTLDGTDHSDSVLSEVLDAVAEVSDVVASDPDAPTCQNGPATAKWHCYTADQLKYAAENKGMGGNDTGPKDADAVAYTYTGVLPPDGCPAPAAIEYCCQDLVGPGTVQGGSCCYWDCTSCICGRPLTIAGAARSAATSERGDWQADFGVIASTAHAAALAAAWRADALDEHASVASFQRFGLELLACGAPPELVAAASHATIDEIAHARLCFGIAMLLDGRSVGPGALDCTGLQIRGDLAVAAVAAVREGCVGETLAAAQVGAAARLVQNAKVAEALARIAEDEARHAELAWQFVAWACEEGGETVRAAVAAAFAEALAAQPSVDAREAELRGVPDAIRAAWGRLPQGEARRLSRAVLAEVVAPCAARLARG